MTTPELYAYLQLAEASGLVRPPPEEVLATLKEEWRRRPVEEQAAAQAQAVARGDDVAGPIVQTIFVRRCPCVTARTLARPEAAPARASRAPGEAPNFDTTTKFRARGARM